MTSSNIRPRRTSLVARLFALAVSCLVLAASQLYFALSASGLTYGASTLAFGVLVPLLVGCFLLLVTDQKVALLGYVGLFWSIVDDAPVYFDSVLTWPNVTRFNPFLPHLELEIILHILTFLCLIGAVWLQLKRRGGGTNVFLSYSLALVSFVFSYAQNIPLRSIESIVAHSWYQLDIVEHLLAIIFFCLALFVTRRS